MVWNAIQYDTRSPPNTVLQHYDSPAVRSLHHLAIFIATHGRALRRGFSTEQYSTTHRIGVTACLRRIPFRGLFSPQVCLPTGQQGKQPMSLVALEGRLHQLRKNSP